MINIVTIPPEYNLVTDEIIFTLNMTGVSSDTESKTLKYFLALNDGTPITPYFYFTPEEGQDFIVEFRRDLYSLVFTEHPILSNPYGVVRDEPEMIKRVKLGIIEVTFNKETCVSEEGAETFTPAIYVINAASNPLSLVAVDSDFMLLSHRPRYYYGCQDSDDLFYLLTAGGILFATQLFDQNGQLISQSGLTSATFPSKIGSLNFKLNTLDDNVSYMNIILLRGETEYIFTKRFVDCCDYRTLYFQGSKGGLNTVVGKLSNTGITGTSTQVYNNPKSTNSKYVLANKDSYLNLTLTITTETLKVTDTNFYNELQTSGKYYIKMPTNFAEDSFILEQVVAAEFEHDEVAGKIDVKLKLANDITQPNYYN